MKKYSLKLLTSGRQVWYNNRLHTIEHNIVSDGKLYVRLVDNPNLIPEENVDCEYTDIVLERITGI
jgi:hypothetical protein